MTKILLIRRGRGDQYYWKQVLTALPVIVYDACEPWHIRVEYLGTNGDVQLFFCGLPLASFDRIVYLGTPIWKTGDPDEVQFACSELEASLLAALRMGDFPVINRGLCLAFNKLLQQSIPFCKDWEKAGWKLPSITYSYDGGALKKDLSPNPAAARSYILYITTQDYFLWPNYAVVFNQHRKFAAIIERMQHEMYNSGLDLLVMQFFSWGDDFYLFAHIPELPVTDIEKITALIKPVLL